MPSSLPKWRDRALADAGWLDQAAMFGMVLVCLVPTVISILRHRHR